MAKWRTRIRSTFERFFPERQIYHRSAGTVNYISISPWQQSLMALGALAVAGWCVYATVMILLAPAGSTYGAAGGQEVARLERWVQQLRAQEALNKSLLEERTDAFQRATVGFEERHENLKIILDELNGSDELEVSALRGDGATMLVEASIDEADPRQSRELIQTASAIEVVGVRARLERLRGDQSGFLDDAETLAVERAERARGILQLTGVGLNRIGGDTQRAMGGPLVDMLALSSSDISDPDDKRFAERVVQVAARLEETRNYEDIVASLPLAQPSSVPLRLTSNYGLRADPFSRRSAWHSGIDMAAYYKAPINASGPGEVVFAGRKSGYGRLVEIDHGYGFRSRYAHLHSITVSKGDIVEVGDKVGLMGSSGRSTGPHLHFEVIFQGKPYNPRGFLKAGQHVYEG
ncbi:MAG: peptidoglycan DD-metalloendopeptidase family protein [Pseudomonadota bacterium]